MSTSEHSDDVWQGMVAAVACLLLALLLLMSILALSIVQVGTEYQKRQSKAKAAEPVRTEQTQLAQWVLKFSAHDVTLETEQRRQLVQDFRPTLMQMALTWRLWVNVPANDGQLERQAYLRLLTVRGMLMDAGIAPDRIQLRIVQTPDTPAGASANAAHVFVMRAV